MQKGSKGTEVGRQRVRDASQGRRAPVTLLKEQLVHTRERLELLERRGVVIQQLLARHRDLVERSGRNPVGDDIISFMDELAAVVSGEE